MDGCTEEMLNKIKGSFHALTIMGSAYVNGQRFKPLTGKGKPLWEFKEFDHRLYCVRNVNGSFVEVVLLYGWSKDKKGLSKEEPRQIDKALLLYEEYLTERGSK